MEKPLNSVRVHQLLLHLEGPLKLERSTNVRRRLPRCMHARTYVRDKAGPDVGHKTSSHVSKRLRPHTHKFIFNTLWMPDSTLPFPRPVDDGDDDVPVAEKGQENDCGKDGNLLDVEDWCPEEKAEDVIEILWSIR